LATNEIPDGIVKAYKKRSVKQKLDQIQTPALVIQGWHDTLFTPNEGVWNYQRLKERGVESRLIMYSGGHTPREIAVSQK
ncbi:MAG: CocE/NonD family hydrolase, partial [Halobacteria archaeon]|nr:CocE/NonD family hydrolase [Halobacteria archaeon]